MTCGHSRRLTASARALIAGGIEDHANKDDGVVFGPILGIFLGIVGPFGVSFLGIVPRNSLRENGAGDRNRTGDPVITSDVLYQLSYTSPQHAVPRSVSAGRLNKKDGATPQNRTGDTVIFSHVLYQLS